MTRLQIFAELAVLIKGTLGGMRTLLWSLVLLSLPLYAASLLLRETLGEMQDEKDESHSIASFSTVPLSFFTLFRCTVAGDCAEQRGRPIFLEVIDYGWWYGLVYMVMVFFMTMGLFNVIAAIFVENVVAGAKTSDQLVKRQRMRDKAFFAGKIYDLLKVIVHVEHSQSECSSGRRKKSAWAAATGQSDEEDIVSQVREVQITADFFERLQDQPQFCDIMGDLNVAPDEQGDLFETLDLDGNGVIEVEELVDGIARLRGEARRSDVVSLNLMIRFIHVDICQSIISNMRPLWSRLNKLEAKLTCIHKDLKDIGRKDSDWDDEIDSI